MLTVGVGHGKNSHPFPWRPAKGGGQWDKTKKEWQRIICQMGQYKSWKNYTAHIERQNKWDFHNHIRITHVPKEEIWFVCSWLASSIVLFVLVASFSTNLLYSFLWLTNISSGIYCHTCIVRDEREMYEHLYNTLIIVDLHQSSCGHKSNTKQRYRCLTYLFITCIHCISRSFGPCITIGDAEPSQQGSNSAYVPSLNFPSLIDRLVHISIPKHSDENHAQMN